MNLSTRYRQINKDHWPYSFRLVVDLFITLTDFDFYSNGGLYPLLKYNDKFCTRVVLVGSNPSQKSPDNTPFHPSTKSRQFVDKWFEDIPKITVMYRNLVDEKTKNNKQLRKSDIDIEDINYKFETFIKQNSKIIACGKVAAMGLTMAGIEHFEMPHPSGLCRFWNDKEAGEAKVKEMLEWIKS